MREHVEHIITEIEKHSVCLQMKLIPEEVRQSLSSALCKSLCWDAAYDSSESEISNSLRSSKFAHFACEALDGLVRKAGSSEHPRPKLRHIKIPELKPLSGEWLLDGVWTQDVSMDDRIEQHFPLHICCALECESNTSGRAFFEDFAKLLVVDADVKIFLGGLNQTTEGGVSRYINRRISQCNGILKHQSLGADWYIGFWPSPQNSPTEDENPKSLWSDLHQGNYAFLKAVQLFHLSEDGFARVN